MWDQSLRKGLSAPLRSSARRISRSSSGTSESQVLPRAILDTVTLAELPRSSNNTKESTNALLEKLRGMGFTAHRHEIMTSLGACRQLVEDRGLRSVPL